jgi:transcriptional repressor NF-X1
MVKVRCKCGRFTREIPCGASAKSESSTGTAMSCDVSCVLKEREEKLKDAFGVKETSESSAFGNVPYSTAMLKIANAQQKWCTQVEGIMREFMESNDHPTMFFKPMRREQRAFVHELAESYGLFSESQDPEPKRSVFVAKKSTSGAPDMLLTEAIKLYQTHLNKTVKIPLKKSLGNPEPVAITYNAILMDDCLEGVTRDDLDEVVRPHFLRKRLLYGFQWLDKGKYLIVPEAFMRKSQQKENALTDICAGLQDVCKKMFLANTVNLVKIDIDYNIEKVESLQSHSDDGDFEQSNTKEEISGNEASAISCTSDEATQEIPEESATENGVGMPDPQEITIY